jgi:hypothetical protein
MGRRGSGQRCKCGQATLGQNPQGASSPPRPPDPTRPCHRTDQGDISLGVVSAPRDPSWEESGDDRRGIRYHVQCLSHALAPGTLPCIRGQLF